MKVEIDVIVRTDHPFLSDQRQLSKLVDAADIGDDLAIAAGLFEIGAALRGGVRIQINENKITDRCPHCGFVRSVTYNLCDPGANPS